MTDSGGLSAVQSVARALASFEWTLQRSRRESIEAGRGPTPPVGDAALVYVSTGAIAIDTGDTRGEVSLLAGDIAFWPHRVWQRAVAIDDTELVIVELAPLSATNPAYDALPDAVVVHEFAALEPGVAALAEAMARAPGETCAPQNPHAARAGDSVICSRMATMIASVAVRAWLELGCAPARWADRLHDPHIARVVDAVRAAPGNAWSVDDLARIAAMSRSGFAERFRVVLGQSPAAYLSAIRMEAAMPLLAEQGLSVLATAHRLGYESEEGFVRAFRRHTGQTPARWRRDMRQPARLSAS